MSEPNRGEVAAAVLKAIMAEKDFAEAGVPDTPYNRGVWDRMKRQVDDVPPGDIVDIPSDV